MGQEIVGVSRLLPNLNSIDVSNWSGGRIRTGVVDLVVTSQEPP